MDIGLSIKPAESCRWDCAALGEVMLRLDPGENRVRNARQFQVWEGGGEYNLARGLRKTFGLRSTALTALPDSEVGRLVEDLMLQGGMDVSNVIWRTYDGLGRNTRVGLNFTERGFGLRAPLGVSDRGNSSASQIRPGDFDWDAILARQGVRWLHTGGVFATLTDQTGAVVHEALAAARRNGTVTSFDLNYRASLWNNLGDPGAVRESFRQIVSQLDVLFADAEGVRSCLGLEIPGYDPKAGPMEPGNFEAMQSVCKAHFPNLRVIACTQRAAPSATLNDWSALLWASGQTFRAAVRTGVEILDRVGGGDSFAAGVVFALLEGLGPQAAVDFGAAHGALAMTTPGDNAMVSRQEVEAVIAERGGRAIR